jgi:FAD synthase
MMNRNCTWTPAVVSHGDKSGRKIGFPTINLDPAVVPQDTPQGVYASRLKIVDREYLGALYFGPRLVKGETHNVLEIFILDFSAEIYGQTVQFSLGKFIRPVLHFNSLEELQQQLQKDIAAVRVALSAEN